MSHATLIIFRDNLEILTRSDEKQRCISKWISRKQCIMDLLEYDARLQT